MTSLQTENSEPAPAPSPQDGLHALRQLSEHLAAGPRAQFVHRFVPTDHQYVVRHAPEGCALCAWITTIEAALLQATKTSGEGS